MEYKLLGRTDLEVSVAGLGCGGPSRLGMRDDPHSENNAVSLVKEAIELGVNFLDTAESYGTEPIVGKAIAGFPRERLIISSKKALPAKNHLHPEEEIRKGLDQSLKLLKTDYLDVYHLHGVEPQDYEHAKNRLLPEMRRLKERGKIRFIGVTEGFVTDPQHRMLRKSLMEDSWDVIMVGFNLLNSGARKAVFSLTTEKKVGVLNMFAVRRALSQPKRLKELVGELISKGVVKRGAINPDDPLDFILRDGDAHTLPEAAYRFCRHEPGVDVVLTGTGNPAHLKENIAAILKPALPRPVLDKIDQIFGKLDYLTGN